jgi:hypothetical protein
VSAENLFEVRTFRIIQAAKIKYILVSDLMKEFPCSQLTTMNHVYRFDFSEKQYSGVFVKLPAAF